MTTLLVNLHMTKGTEKKIKVKNELRFENQAALLQGRRKMSDPK